MRTEETIKILIQDPSGAIVDVVTLDELIATGDDYDMHLVNRSRDGSASFKIIVQNEPQLLEKVRIARLKQEQVFDDSEADEVQTEERAELLNELKNPLLKKLRQRRARRASASVE